MSDLRAALDTPPPDWLEEYRGPEGWLQAMDLVRDALAATPEPTLDAERLAEAIEVQDPSIPDPRAFADGVADVYARPIVRDWPRVFVHPAANLDLATLEYVKESIEGIQHGGGTVEPFGLIESIIRVRAELRGDATP